MSATTLKKPTSIKIDDTITINERAGSGLYGRVWKGNQDGKLVAVKVIHAEMRHVASALEHFNALVRIEGHPNIVKVLALARVKIPEEVEPVEAVIMEWLEGKRLDSRLAGSRFSRHDAHSHCLNIVDGLIHMHSRGVAHGDLHAANVILTVEGAKIIDVDVAKTHSLRALTLQSREVKIAADIDYARALICQIILHSKYRLDTQTSIKAQLEQATSLEDLRTSLALLTDVVDEATNGTAATQPNKDRTQRSSSIGNKTTTQEALATAIENGRRVTARRIIVSLAKQYANELISDEFSTNEETSNAAFTRRVARYETLATRSIAAVALAAYWGRRANISNVLEAFDIVANVTHDNGPRGGINWWLDLEIYPAALMMYGAGIAALANNRYMALSRILSEPLVYPFAHERQRLSSRIWSWKSSNTGHWNSVFGTNRYTPISDHICNVLRQALREWLERNRTYDDTFDKFEYISGLVECKRTMSEKEGGWGPTGPIGRFVWRGDRQQDKVWQRVDQEISDQGSRWGGYTSGLFASPDEFKTVQSTYFNFIDRVRRQNGWF